MCIEHVTEDIYLDSNCSRVFKKTVVGWRDGQWLNSCTAAAEDLGSIPSIHIRQLTTPVTPGVLYNETLS